MKSKMILLRSLLTFVLVIIILTPIILVFSAVQVDGDPVVLTSAGVIRGMRATDGDYSMFLGIPYATVNDSNVFGPAIPSPPFEAIFDAVHDSVPCPQQPQYTLGSLDCLHLNVYAPSQAGFGSPIPVLVFIHGGHFMHGYGSKAKYGPRFLVRHGVILVTINYRINAYGFMCLHTPEVPGNQGLKDQLIAMKWVKENIAAFGGDVNKITLFGESSGAALVDMHLLYSNNGLFQQIITESGTSLSPWAIDEPDETAASKLAKHLGFDTHDESEAIAFLSKQPSDRVIKAMDELDLTFTPCIEKIASTDRFINEHPLRTPTPRAEHTPIITGYNSDEALIIAILTREERPFHVELAKAFDFGDKAKRMEEYVRHFYVGDETISLETRRPVTDFQSDILFTTSTQRSVHKYLKYGAKFVYHYVFSYTGNRNVEGITIKRNLTVDGAAHADELGYLFDMPEVTDRISPNDQQILDRMTTLWTNFAKYGNPTPKPSKLLPIKWPPVTRTKLKYLEITTNMRSGSRPFRERQAFWEYFYDVNHEYVKGYSRNDSF